MKASAVTRLAFAAALAVAGTAAGAAPALAGTPGAGGSHSSPASRQQLGQHLAAAAYITPTSPDWPRLIATGRSLGFVVVNVSNGPGSAEDDAWKSVIDKAHAAGVKVLGYVDTGYLGGSDPVRTTRLGDTDATSWMVQAEQDVDRWYSFYGASIDGVFFDDGMNTCGPTSGSSAFADDYRYLTEVLHEQHLGALSVLNPGISVPQCYEDAADVLATFEGPASSYLDPTADLAPLPWQATADPDKFWNIVYDVDQSQLPAVMAAAKANNAGYVYATDDTLPNPYDTIPSDAYWAQESALATPSRVTPPRAVTGVAARSRTATTVTLGWPAVPKTDAVGYDVYENGVKVAAVGADQAGRNGFAYTVSGLVPSHRYSFDVRARSASGAQASGRVVTASTRPASGPLPATPSDVTVSAVSAGSALLSWGADQARTVTGYSVAVNGVQTLALPASVHSAHIGGLPLGAGATFTVTALGADGRNSRPSVTVTASIPSPTPITDAAIDFGPDVTTFSADYNVAFSFDHVFIDTDSQTSTGYQFGGVGAEFMIENGIIYRDADDSNSWNWSPVTLDSGPLVSSRGGHYVWQVPSSVFGSSSSLTAVFSGTGTYPDYTLAPVTAEKHG
ncbi:spherulation-specific family 4 protein [Gryllotalpicola koreensis]|uniref:Fibronectin type-III domain-containing protein n=1 Tax=Gryllotalpicola koreensis TaxID=993086 RepID=A0ABP7ZZZ9_9MICO